MNDQSMMSNQMLMNNQMAPDNDVVSMRSNSMNNMVQVNNAQAHSGMVDGNYFQEASIIHDQEDVSQLNGVPVASAYDNTTTFDVYVE